MSATLTVLRRRLADAAMYAAEADIALRASYYTPQFASDPVAWVHGHAITADRANRQVMIALAEVRALLAQDVMEFDIRHSAHCLDKLSPQSAGTDTRGGSVPALNTPN